MWRVQASPDGAAMTDAILALRRTHIVVNAVMCLAERDGMSERETLERMVIELAKADDAKLAELIRIASETPPVRFVPVRP